MSFENQKKAIVDICKNVLENKKADVVLAYAEGGIDGASVPIFIKSPESLESASIKWDSRCVQNLSTYLLGRKEKVAIVAKPCDVRAIVNYIVELQLNRDAVYIIGVDCAGMQDVSGNSLPGCAECRVHIPPIFDEHVAGDAISTATFEPDKASENLEENLERFQKEMEKCILCYSCRQACPGCYCEVCFMDRGVPNWQPTEPDMGTKMTYHLGRAMHLAGRCVECGACERVCASGVNIRYLIQKVTDFVDELYGHRTGLDLDTQPAMVSFSTDDREVGFMGGGAHE